MHKKLIILFIFLVLISCSSENTEKNSTIELKYFGFVAVDCAYDDPLDKEIKTNYLDEVSSFTNIAHMCVFSEEENLTERISAFKDAGIMPVIAIESLFIDSFPDNNTNSGNRIFLLEDYESKWNKFVKNNPNLVDNEVMFYLMDEPYHNGFNFEDLNKVTNIIKKSYPETSLFLVEAFSSLKELRIPENVDFIGFDQYDVIDPREEKSYIKNLDILKSKRSNPNQGFFLIMDTQWKEYYQEDGAVTPEDMATIAENYYSFAKEEGIFTGIFGYLWPGGLDEPTQKGARNLPKNVLDNYKKIGNEIIKSQ